MDTFTVTHCNVRGLRSKLDNLHHMMNEVSLSGMFVSDTNLNSGVIDNEINVPGYTLQRLDRKNPRNLTFGGGRVAMYLKHYIPFSALSIPSDKEVLCVKVNLPNKSFVIGTVYNPPKMKITGHVEEYMEFLKQKFPKSGIIVKGDFKIHHG